MMYDAEGWAGGGPPDPVPGAVDLFSPPVVTKPKRTFQRERMLDLARRLRCQDPKMDIGFDMGTWLQERECGTFGCIAGWTVAIYAPRRLRQAIRDTWTVESSATRLLGLTKGQAQILFCPNSYGGQQNTYETTVTASMAAAGLELLATLPDNILPSKLEAHLSRIYA